MSKQTISKRDAERRLSEQVRSRNPHAGPVTLEEARPGEWNCVAERGVDASIDAEGMLRDFLKTYQIADVPDAVPVEKMDATNDE